MVEPLWASLTVEQQKSWFDHGGRKGFASDMTGLVTQFDGFITYRIVAEIWAEIGKTVKSEVE